MSSTEPIYKEIPINSRNLEPPREAYQRPLNMARVERIAAEFDEHIANEPKVSFRNGHYYVFDGQHTIAARKYRNNGRDLPILCKVYYGLSEAEEALLFVQQTGLSAAVTAGIRIRARIFAGDPEAVAFQRATEAMGYVLDFGQERGLKRIGCISTAFNEYRMTGDERYRETLRILMEAWGGDPDSVRAETLQAMSRFVDLYYGEYNHDRLVRQCAKTHPLTIYRKGKALTGDIPGYKKYLLQIFNIYNGTSRKTCLPLKF